jgi:sulfatase maturation enzyme AslB (radical SAM superfamily)
MVLFEFCQRTKSLSTALIISWSHGLCRADCRYCFINQAHSEGSREEKSRAIQKWYRLYAEQLWSGDLIFHVNILRKLKV